MKSEESTLGRRHTGREQASRVGEMKLVASGSVARGELCEEGPS